MRAQTIQFIPRDPFACASRQFRRRACLIAALPAQEPGQIDDRFKLRVAARAFRFELNCFQHSFSSSSLPSQNVDVPRMTARRLSASHDFCFAQTARKSGSVRLRLSGHCVTACRAWDIKTLRSSIPRGFGFIACVNRGAEGAADVPPQIFQLLCGEA